MDMHMHIHIFRSPANLAKKLTIENGYYCTYKFKKKERKKEGFNKKKEKKEVDNTMNDQKANDESLL